jgi:hypothetical protein
LTLKIINRHPETRLWLSQQGNPASWWSGLYVMDC